MKRLSRIWHFISGALLSCPERFFLIIALAFGLIFCFLTPPAYNYDESMHYARVEAFIEGDILLEAKTDTTGMVNGYGRVDENVLRFVDEYVSRFGELSPECEFDLPLSKYDTENLHRSGNLVDSMLNPDAIYTPLVFMPQIIAGTIGKTVSLGLFDEFFMMRIFGLIASVLLIALAIKIIPTGKWLLLAVGLLPMSVVSYASISPDGLTIAGILLFVATVFRCALAKEVKVIHYLPLVLLALSVALVKMSYLPVLLLLVCIPILNKQYRKTKRIVALCSILMIGVVAGYLWYRAVGNIWVNYQDTSLQIHFIVHNPLSFAKILVINLTTFSISELPRMMNLFGIFHNTQTAINPLFMLLSMASVASGTIVSEHNDEAKFGFGKATNTVLIVVSLMTIVLIYTSLYIAYNTVGSVHIDGVQGRYFIPVLPLMFLPFTHILSHKYYRSAACFTSLASGACLVVATVAIITHFY
jgi:uncharacterized membrane protein